MSTRLRASGLLAALVAVGLLAALVSALLVGGARSANSAAGLIAFTHDGREDSVYVVGVDGTGLHRLWQGTRSPTEVTWSPDGRRLAFVTSDGRVRLMNADGSGVLRIASVAARSLSWSADGRRIAFTSKDDIWLMNADGSHMRRLARTPNLGESTVDWKPTGGWLAFDRGGYVSQLYVIRTNGRNLQVIESSTFWDAREPDWSPDGRRLAFRALPVGGTGDTDSEIWVLNANGTSPVRLTRNDVFDGSPAWSPDGRKIAFVRGDRGPDAWEIYVMNADGSGARKLTKGASPAWQPIARAGG